MWPDGQTSVMFQNGDLKEIRSDGVVVYHYRATGAVQTTLTDGTELYQFSDGQTERHCLDGSKEIRFPNGTTKKIYSNGSEEVCFADGTIKTTPLPPKWTQGEGEVHQKRGKFVLFEDRGSVTRFCPGKNVCRSRWIMWPGGFQAAGAEKPHFGGGSQPKTIQLDSGSKNSILPSRLCYHGSQWWPLVCPVGQPKTRALAGGWVWEETEVSNISSVIVEKQGWQ